MNIIICDDCQEDRKLLHNLLREYEKNSEEKFNITEYELGTELCRDESALQNCQIVFLDINMDEQDGLKTAIKIKELYQKFYTAKEKQISMIFQIGDVHEILLTEEEIVILLCNLLDNAINECEKVVKAGRDAVIQFKLVCEDEKVILSVKNPVLHKVEIIDNKVRSNCEKGHGIGLKNVESVVEKYDGSIAFDCDDKEFKAVVIL